MNFDLDSARLGLYMRLGRVGLNNPDMEKRVPQELRIKKRSKPPAVIIPTRLSYFSDSLWKDINQLWENGSSNATTQKEEPKNVRSGPRKHPAILRHD